MLSALISLFGGGLVGLLGKGLDKWSEGRNKKLDIELAKLQGQAIVEGQEAKAFGIALKSEPYLKYDLSQLSPLQKWIALSLEWFRKSIRPGITTYLIIITTMLYLDAQKLLGVDFVLPSMAHDLVVRITDTILELTRVCIGFWFGTRLVKK